MVYIFDIDGTLSDLTHRLHFIQQTPKDWDGFFGACGADAPQNDVIRLCQDIQKAGNKLVLMTGRPECVRTNTVRWLNKLGIEALLLYMRRDGDYRNDALVKSEMLDEFLRVFHLSDIGGVFEDRRCVVDMFRNRGLRVYQVAAGEF